MESNPIKILFVDDETAFLETLIKRMKKRGIDATGVNSGEEAIVFRAGCENAENGRYPGTQENQKKMAID